MSPCKKVTTAINTKPSRGDGSGEPAWVTAFRGQTGRLCDEPFYWCHWSSDIKALGAKQPCVTAELSPLAHPAPLGTQRWRGGRRPRIPKAVEGQDGAFPTQEQQQPASRAGTGGAAGPTPGDCLPAVGARWLQRLTCFGRAGGPTDSVFRSGAQVEISPVPACPSRSHPDPVPPRR